MAQMATSVDASVHQLMAKIQDLDTRRRVSMMCSKELETKLSFASEEHSSLLRDVTALTERESTLKRTLELLADEQRQLQLRSESSQRSLQCAEKEEPLLMTAAESALTAAQSKLRLWNDENAALASTVQKWFGGSETTSFAEKLESLSAEILQLQSEEQSLVAFLAEAEQNRSKAPSLPAGQLKSTCSSNEDAAALQASEIESLQMKLSAVSAAVECQSKAVEELSSQSARQKAILSREVRELTNRVEELQHSVADTLATNEELSASIAEMSSALHRCTCSSCESSRSVQ